MLKTNDIKWMYICDATQRILGLQGNVYVDIDIVDMGEIQELNKTTRNIDEVTDVLSYPFIHFEFNSVATTVFDKVNYPFEYDTELEAVNIGSIVICEQVAINQAMEYGHSLEREYAYLFVHGLLHLLGYDHILTRQKNQMRKIEEKILKSINLVR